MVGADCIRPLFLPFNAFEVVEPVETTCRLEAIYCSFDRLNHRKNRLFAEQADRKNSKCV